MKFAIFTHVIHKRQHNLLYAYAPYVNEMNLWIKNVTEVLIVAPLTLNKIIPIDEYYSKKNIVFKEIPIFNLLALKNKLDAILKIPLICFQIYKAMKWADHIHLRCPGNIGLLASVVQILFPKKSKTIKYAGNWDPNSSQPLSYRFQKWIISNTFLTKNAKVLVYGEWPNQSKNTIPFFTASYSEREIEEANRHPKLVSGSHEIERNNQTLKQVWHEEKEPLSEQSEAISSKDTAAMLYGTSNNDKTSDNSINFIFVGTLSKGKQPILSVKVVQELKLKGYKVKLNLYGEGVERNNIENYIKENNLQNEIALFGNVNKIIIKQAYKKANFLLFISKSEGWPKVVAEAMFWGCLPISSNVSCIPYMLGNGIRGSIVNANVKEIVLVIENYLNDNKKYQDQAKNAMEWSQQYTLEYFEKEISNILIN